MLAQTTAAERTEDEAREKQRETINKLLPWRLRHAEALLAEPPGKHILAGAYCGSPDLKLEVDDSGNVSGTFVLPPTIAALGNSAPAILKGKVSGRAVAFTWNLVKDEGSWFSPRPSSGHGVLIWGERCLSGFRVGGNWSLDLTDAVGFTDWELEKQEGTDA